MNSQVRALFHELADLTADEREQIFRARGTGPEMRAEVESLLLFDSAEDNGLTGRVSRVAESLLSSVDVLEDARCGPYRLVRLLGSGGMGAVYLAERTDGEVQQTVAVKLLRADEERAIRHERFLKERQFLASLKHPSIVHLIDAGRMENGRPYLVMEFVDGVPIDVYSAGISVRERLELFLRVCDGVSHAHQHLIIHRDLKPSNILVEASGQPKVLDFGIAKLLDEGGDSTQTVERLLTPGYASPEQLRGSLQTTATDVYSLGAVLYKILTGRSPQESATGAMDVMTDCPASQWDASLSRDIDAILGKALRHEPEERYASVEAFASDVRAFLESKPVEARSGNAWYRTRKFLRRYRVSVAAAALVIASLAGGLYLANRQRLIAERRFGQLRQLSSKVLDLDVKLANLPGAIAARNEIVATTRAYLEGLGKDAAGDRDLSLEIASSYLKLARIQGVAMGYNLAQYAEAEKSLHRANEFVERVLIEDPGNRKALLQAANIAHDRALTADSELRPADVVSHGGEAVAYLDRLKRLGRLTIPEINNAAYMYANLAQVHINTNQYDAAIRYARLGVDVSRGEEKIPGPRAQALCLLANAMRNAGDLEGALENLRQARVLVEHGTFDLPRYRSHISIRVSVQEGRLLGEDDGINLNHPTEAAAAFREAFELAESMIKKEPKDTYSRAWLAIAGHQLGNILRHSDPKQALEVFDESLARNREVLNDINSRRLEAAILADSAYAAPNSKNARERIDAAFALLRESKDFPAARIKQGSEIDVAYRALGDHYAATGQPAKAASTYRELLEKLKIAKTDEQRNLLDALSVSRCYEVLAPALRRMGSAKDAAAVDAQRLELWRAWDVKLPSNAFVRRQLDASVHP